MVLMVELVWIFIMALKANRAHVHEVVLNLMIATVQSLNLSWNGLEALGSAAIFKALAENRGLICLNVSSTRTSNSSCVHLATALRKNSTLEQLIVNNNGLSSESEQLLVQALNVNRTLNHLDLKVSDNTRSCYSSTWAQVVKAAVVEMPGISVTFTFPAFTILSQNEKR